MSIKSYLLSSIMIFSLEVPTRVLSSERAVKKPFWMPALEYVNQSRLASFFEKNIQTQIISGSSFGTELCSEKYQMLAKEAQTNVGISDELQDSAYKLNDNGGPFADMISALAFPDSIIVNEKRLDAGPYGYQRVAMHHEAVHKKNNDLSFNTLTDFGPLIVTGIFCHYGLKRINPNGKSKLIHAMGVLVPSIVAAYFVNSNYAKMYERRADIEGLYAANCATCAFETAARRKKMFETEKNPLAHNGYLFADEIEVIARDLQKQGAICAHHKQHA